MESQKEPFKRTKVTQSGLDILIIKDKKSNDMLKIIPSQKKIYYLSPGVVKRLKNLEILDMTMQENNSLLEMLKLNVKTYKFYSGKSEFKLYERNKKLNVEYDITSLFRKAELI